MGKRTLQNWELRLHLTQVLVLTGAVMGGMACAYYLGFFSGRNMGLELAMANSAVSVARLPVIPALPAEQGEEDTSEVYAKLNAERALNVSPVPNADGVEDVPELTTIQTTGEGEAVIAEPPAEAPTPPQESPSSFDPESVARAAGADPASLKEDVVPPQEHGKKTEDAPPPPTVKKPAEEVPPSPSKEEKQKEEKAKAAELKKEKAQEKKKEEAAKKDAKSEQKPQVAKKEADSAPSLKVEQKDTGALPKGWFAQVAARQKEAEAKQIAEKLRASGFPVVVEAADVNGEKYYRILVGPEESKQTADRLIAQLKREPYIQGNPFVRGVR